MKKAMSFHEALETKGKKVSHDVHHVHVEPHPEHEGMAHVEHHSEDHEVLAEHTVHPSQLHEHIAKHLGLDMKAPYPGAEGEGAAYESDEGDGGAAAGAAY